MQATGVSAWHDGSKGENKGAHAKVGVSMWMDSTSSSASFSRPCRTGRVTTTYLRAQPKQPAASEQRREWLRLPLMVVPCTEEQYARPLLASIQVLQDGLPSGCSSPDTSPLQDPDTAEGTWSKGLHAPELAPILAHIWCQGRNTLTLRGAGAEAR
jgi:hypothetical protein